MATNMKKFKPIFDFLESKHLLSSQIVLPISRPFVIAPGDSIATLRKYYDFDYSSNPASRGAGITIAIVDAYNWTPVVKTLDKFSKEYKLSKPGINVYNLGASGNTANNTGWDAEEALDTQVIHAMAPYATIDFIEAASDSVEDMINADNYAISLPNVVVVNDSWGVVEYQNELQNDIVAPHTVITASTGDVGGVVFYPSALPDVVGVGGTELLDTKKGLKENPWLGSGGGTSVYVPKPSYQISLPYSGRSLSDVSMDGDPYTGFNILFDGFKTLYGGTSLSCALFSALVGIGQAERVANNLAPLNSTQLLNLMYSNPQAFHGIEGGYTQITGLGSPIGKVFLSIMNVGAAEIPLEKI
jgi:subtilase family serine protease